MSISNAPISSTQTAASIDEAARKFVLAPKFFKILEQHRLAILTLRAREASCLQIQDLLKDHQVFVSEPAIYRFCRKYRHEVLRLRVQLEQETNDSPEPAKVAHPASPDPITNSPLKSPALSSRPMRDLRGGV